MKQKPTDAHIYKLKLIKFLTNRSNLASIESSLPQGGNEDETAQDQRGGLVVTLRDAALGDLGSNPGSR